MRQRYFRPYRYKLTRPPRALMRARLDNIAIVPASMLEGKGRLKEQVKKLSRGEVFLCHTQENTKQRKILERVKEGFRRLGYAVTLLPVDGMV
jgi:hypothetical protein